MMLLHLDMVRFGPPHLGVWCELCLLPSAWCQQYSAVSAMTVVGQWAVSVCDNCAAKHVQRIPLVPLPSTGGDTPEENQP